MLILVAVFVSVWFVVCVVIACRFCIDVDVVICDFMCVCARPLVCLVACACVVVVCVLCVLFVVCFAFGRRVVFVVFVLLCCVVFACFL